MPKSQEIIPTDKDHRTDYWVEKGIPIRTARKLAEKNPADVGEAWYLFHQRAKEFAKTVKDTIKFKP